MPLSLFGPNFTIFKSKIRPKIRSIEFSPKTPPPPPIFFKSRFRHLEKASRVFSLSVLIIEDITINMQHIIHDKDREATHVRPCACMHNLLHAHTYRHAHIKLCKCLTYVINSRRNCIGVRGLQIKFDQHDGYPYCSF